MPDIAAYERLDGYTSLLSKAEGGSCEEIVSEENGILISMMLRQYFMALKVLDQWKHWGPSMDRHWGGVVSNVLQHHPVIEPDLNRRDVGAEELPQPGGRKRQHSQWEDWSPAKLRERRSSILPLDEHADENEHGSEAESEVRDMEKELRIMRKVFRKWSRLAGVHGRACDDLSEGEFTVDWTRAIAPRLEGRIQMVTAEKRTS